MLPAPLRCALSLSWWRRGGGASAALCGPIQQLALCSSSSASAASVMSLAFAFAIAPRRWLSSTARDESAPSPSPSPRPRFARTSSPSSSPRLRPTSASTKSPSSSSSSFDDVPVVRVTSAPRKVPFVVNDLHVALLLPADASSSPSPTSSTASPNDLASRTRALSQTTGIPVTRDENAADVLLYLDPHGKLHMRYAAPLAARLQVKNVDIQCDWKPAFIALVNATSAPPLIRALTHGLPPPRSSPPVDASSSSSNSPTTHVNASADIELVTFSDKAGRRPVKRRVPRFLSAIDGVTVWDVAAELCHDSFLAARCGASVHSFVHNPAVKVLVENFVQRYAAKANTSSLSPALALLHLHSCASIDTVLPNTTTAASLSRDHPVAPDVILLDYTSSLLSDTPSTFVQATRGPNGGTGSNNNSSGSGLSRAERSLLYKMQPRDRAERVSVDHVVRVRADLLARCRRACKHHVVVKRWARASATPADDAERALRRDAPIEVYRSAMFEYEVFAVEARAQAEAPSSSSS